MKKIYFVRHGQSQANADGLASGSEFDTPLTEKGIEQAKKTGLELKGRGIDLIVCSPISRAVDTAQIIAEQIGYNPDKIIKSDYFTERNFGIYSGKTNEEYLSAVHSGSLHASVEPAEKMSQRVAKGLKWLESLQGQDVLIVSHGGVSRILRLMHQDLPLSHMYKLDKQDNASIYEFDL